LHCTKAGGRLIGGGDTGSNVVSNFLPPAVFWF
jgi:hypothetical protein